MKVSWATGDWSKSGKAHLWIESPFNPRYARSGCGLIGSTEGLQAPGEEIGRCRQCEKAEKLRLPPSAAKDGKS